MGPNRFNYKSLEEIEEKSKFLNLNLNFSKNLQLLKTKRIVNNVTIDNSIAYNPMEGCDSTTDGAPSEYTVRRYKRLAKGGAGVIWFEANSVTPEARANPRQLMLTENNINEFKKLITTIKETARNEFGPDFNPVCILQLTHSGRYSKPTGKSEPIIACHNPYLDPNLKINKDYPVVSDDYLEKLEDKFVASAELANEAGFDGVDVKCCHRYLNSELLSCYTRKGKYGGDFDGRTKFLRDVIGKIKSKFSKDFIVTSRINVYDAIPYPYGWGVNKDDVSKYDLTEPINLIKVLHELGVEMVNLTMGNPYYNPHINRPSDKYAYESPEDPILGVARMLNGIGEIKKSIPEMIIIGSGYSWLRQFSPYAAAGCIENGLVDIAGFGRESFAYPDFAKDIFENGSMHKEKCCVTCGFCTKLMRAGTMAGCVIHDSEIYGELFKKHCLK